MVLISALLRAGQSQGSALKDPTNPHAMRQTRPAQELDSGSKTEPLMTFLKPAMAAEDVGKPFRCRDRLRKSAWTRLLVSVSVNFFVKRHVFREAKAAVWALNGSSIEAPVTCPNGKHKSAHYREECNDSRHKLVQSALRGYPEVRFCVRGFSLSWLNLDVCLVWEQTQHPMTDRGQCDHRGYFACHVWQLAIWLLN